MFQGGSCGGQEDAGTGYGEAGPAPATVVRTESHLARFNTARALFEKMGQAEPRQLHSRPAATPAPAVIVKAPPAKADYEAPKGVTVRMGVGRRPLGETGESQLSPRGDSLSPSSSRSTSPSPARPAANGHALPEETPRGGVGLGGPRRSGSASSRSLSASSTDSETAPRRWPPPTTRPVEAPRTNGEGVRRVSRPEKPVKPESLDRRAPAGGHEAHQELLNRHKNWFQSFAKSRSTTAPTSPSKHDGRTEAPTTHSPPRDETKQEDWRSALASRMEPRSPRGFTEQEEPPPQGRDDAPPDTITTTTTTITPTPITPTPTPIPIPISAATAIAITTTNTTTITTTSCSTTTTTSIITTTTSTTTPTNNNITPMTINNNNINSTCLTTTTTTTTTTSSLNSSSSSSSNSSSNSKDQEAWSSVLQTRYGSRARPDLYSPRMRGDTDAAGADWRKERAAILLGRGGQRQGDDDTVVTKGFTRTHPDAPPSAPRFEDAATLQSHWAPPPRYGVAEGGREKVAKDVNNVERCREARQQVRHAKKEEEASLIVAESVVLKDAAKEKDHDRRHPLQPSKEDRDTANAILRDTIHATHDTPTQHTQDGDQHAPPPRPTRDNATPTPPPAPPTPPPAPPTPPSATIATPPAAPSPPPTPPSPPPPPKAPTPPPPPRTPSPHPVEAEESLSSEPLPVEESPPPTPVGEVVVCDVVSVLKAETVYVSSSEDLSMLEDTRSPPHAITHHPQHECTPVHASLTQPEELPHTAETTHHTHASPTPSHDLSQTTTHASPPTDSSPEGKIRQDAYLRERIHEEEQRQEQQEEQEQQQEQEEAQKHDKEHDDEAAAAAVAAVESGDYDGVDDVGRVRRQLFPDLLEGCEGRGATHLPMHQDSGGLISPPPPPLVPCDPGKVLPPPPLSPRTQSIAALDALIHGGEAVPFTPPPPQHTATLEEEEIVYDHTVTSAQHRLQFCTSPVTVEGLVPPDDSISNGTDPEPLPPPIPPHGPPSPATSDPEIMTAEEAQRLLSANIVKSRARANQSVLSDEEAQEVVLLLSPSDTTAPPLPHHSIPDPHQHHPPPVPPHYGGVGRGDEYDSGPAPAFDASMTSPLSPEEEPSEHESSEASAGTEGVSVARVKEVLVEDGVHYLEDGHFWVEVPGLPPEDEDEEEDDPSFPFHPPTRLTFSTQPVQVFSTYSVTEYDRKNDEVDPVAASAEYELEKRVEKMDVFPVEIIKGESGLGLSIIGMGVGADAGVEKLGIFVKTITPGGATERDARIQVNDQIIEVDNKSLVGVTQVFAASVLKNTSGRVHFLIGREKDPENSEVAILIKQSLQADREREERRRALGGPDYDPHTPHPLYDTLSSPSEDNSRSEDVLPHHPHPHPHPHHPHYQGYMEGEGTRGGSGPTSPTHTSSPPPEVFDLEGDTSDTSPDTDVGVLRLKLKEVQYRNAVAEAEITKLKMSLLEMEKVVVENSQYSTQLAEAQGRMADLDTKLHSRETEVATYQDMLEQSQGQYIVLEKKYTKAKKIIKEYQGRERDFLHREEYHITQLEDKDSHYNALVKALKDRVIQLEHELTKAQRSAGLPVQVPADANTQPAFWSLQQSAQNAALAKPPRKPGQCSVDLEISDTETSDPGTSEGDKANTVERKLPVKEELDEAVPPHELLDVSASRAKGELASRGGLANRHLPSLKKAASVSSASSQDQSLDESSLDDDLPEALKHQQQQQQQQQHHHHQQQQHHHHHEEQEHVSRREVDGEGVCAERVERDVSPSKRSPASLMEDVRQAVMHADVSPQHLLPSAQPQPSPTPPATSPQRLQSAFYTPVNKSNREPSREVPAGGGSQSPKLCRGGQGGVCANPAGGGVVLLSQRSLDSTTPPQHKTATGVDASSGDLSSGPASLGSGDEGSGASLGSQTSLGQPQPQPPSEQRSKRSHMWQTAPVVDWTKEQVSQWLVVQGLEGCVARFQELSITGPRLLNIDAKDLKNLALPADDKNKIKRKVKELRLAVEKERKQIEKEKKGREKLQKKAEKLAEKAERKKK